MASSGPRKSSNSPPCVIRVREGRERPGVDEGEVSRFKPPTSPRNSLKKRAGALASNKFKGSPAITSTSSPRTRPSPRCTPRTCWDASGRRIKVERSEEAPTDIKVDRALQSTEELLTRFRQMNGLRNDLNEIDLSDIDSTAGRSRLSSLEAVEDTTQSLGSEGNDVTMDPELAGLLQNVSEVNRLIEDLAVFGEQFQCQNTDLDSLAQGAVDDIEGRVCSSSVARSLAQWPLIKELAILGQKIRDFKCNSDALSISKDLALLRDKLRGLNGTSVEKDNSEFKAAPNTLAAHARKQSEGSQTMSFFSPKSCVIETARSPGSADADRTQSPFRELDPKALTEIVPQIPSAGWTSVHTSYGYASDALLSSMHSARGTNAEPSCSTSASLDGTKITKGGTSQMDSPRILAAVANESFPARHSFPSHRAATISAPIQVGLAAPDIGRLLSPPSNRRATVGGSMRVAHSPLWTAECTATFGGSVRVAQSEALTAEATFFGTPRRAQSPPLPAEVRVLSPPGHRRSLGAARSAAGSAAAPVLPLSQVAATAQTPQAGKAPQALQSTRASQPSSNCGTPGLPPRRSRTISPPSRTLTPVAQSPRHSNLETTTRSVIPSGVFTPSRVCGTPATLQRGRSRETSPAVRTPQQSPQSHAPAVLIQTMAGPPEGVETVSTIITQVSGDAVACVSGVPAGTPRPARMVSLGTPASVQAPVGLAGLGGRASNQAPVSVQAPAGLGSVSGQASVQTPGMASLRSSISFQSPSDRTNTSCTASVQAPAVVRRVSAPTPSVRQYRTTEAVPPLNARVDVLPREALVKQPDAEMQSPTQYIWETVHTTTYRLKALN